MSHPIKKKRDVVHQDNPSPPQWPTYSGTAQYAGTSPSGNVTIYVDPTLGQPALQNAQDLVNDADRVVAQNDTIFGTPGGPVSVIIYALHGQTDGTGGADHDGCDYVTGAAIEVCASFGQPARVSGLFEAELSECSMNGNLCGESTGEGLSRWCAAIISNNALTDFETASTWFDDGMPDWVNRTDPSDQHADSTGCTMAFLSWLLSLGHSLNQIAPAMVSLGDAGTLAQLYANLTGDTASNAWPKFKAAVQALPGGVTDDDPFGGATQPAHLAHLAPGTIALAAKIFGVILADVRQWARQFVVLSFLILLGVSSAEERPAPIKLSEANHPHRLPPLRVRRVAIPVQRNLALARKSNNEFRNPPEWVAETEKEPCALRLTKGRFKFPGASLQSQPGQEIPQTFELLCYENKVHQAIGPTIRVRPGAKFKIRVKNALQGKDDPGASANDPPTYETPHGLCTTNLHTHGLHVSPAGDADNIFRSIDPQGEFTFAYELRSDHPSGTFWYHPHKHGSVAYQLSNGLAGALIVEGDKKQEKNKEGDRIGRLEDVYEIAQADEKVLVVQLLSYRTGDDGDARVDASTIYNVQPDAKSCEAIKVTGSDPPDPNRPPRATAINGIIVPTIRMAPGEVQRWRIVFASWDELLPLVFADKNDQPTKDLLFREIALDGLTTGRMEVKSCVELAPGQRSDVLIQAPLVPKGQEAVYFLKQEGMTAAQSLHGVPADPAFLAKIVISGDQKPDKSSLPDEKLLSGCQPFKPVLPADLSPTTDVFKDGILFNGIDLTRTYNINYRTFHGYQGDVPIKLGSAQEWTIKAAPPVKDPNDSNPESNYYANNHPFHIHVNPFQIIKQIGPDGTVTDWESKNVWRDTLLVHGGESYTIRMRFLDFPGRTVLHCHILDHEDQGMMVPLNITEDPAGVGVKSAHLKPAFVPAPALKLPDTKGARQELCEFRGRNVILVFFQGLECSHCTKQIHKLVREARGLIDSDAEIVAVSSLRIADQDGALKRLGVSTSDRFHLLVDEGHHAFRSFGCYENIPLHGVFLIDPSGIIRFRYVGEAPFADTKLLVERVRDLSGSVKKVFP